MGELLHEQQLRQRAHGTAEQVGEQPYLRGSEIDVLNEAVPCSLNAYADWALAKTVGTGKFQLRYQFLLGCFPKVLLGAQVMIHIFVTLPPRLLKSGEEFEAEHCDQPRKNIVFAEPTSSVVSDFGLICEWEFGLPLLGTVFFLGWAIGVAFLGAVADERGRRFATVTSFAVFQAGGLLALAAPGYSAYALARFLTGFGVGGMSVAGYVWAVELMAPDSRSHFMKWAGICFALGIMLLSPFSVAMPFWRELSFFIFLLGLPVLIYLPYLQESPKWLSTQQHSDELYRGLCHIAQVNGQPFPPPPPRPEAPRLGGGQEHDCCHGGKKPLMGVLRRLASDQRISWRLYAMCVAWFAGALTYYGISLNLRHLEGSIYVSSAVAASMDIPAVIFGSWAVEQRGCFFGRRGIGVTGMALGGICCLLCIPVVELDGPSSIMQGLVYTAKFAIGMSIPTLYLFVSELFPTTLRSTCLGLLSFVARVGSMLAPPVVSMGAYYSGSLPLALFGATSLLAGLSLATLPETLGQPLYDTLDELESSLDTGKEPSASRWSCPWCRSQQTETTLTFPPAVPIWVGQQRPVLEPAPDTEA